MTHHDVEPSRSASLWREALHTPDDPIAALLSTSPGRGALGLNPLAPSVLEVAVVWCGQLLELRQVSEGAFTVGESPVGAAAVDVLVAAEHLPEPTFRLFEVHQGQALARLSPAWRCTLRGDARPLDTDEEGLSAVRLREGDGLTLDLGPLCLIARVTPAGARIAARREAPDRALGVSGLLSAVVGAALALVALSTPPRPQTELLELPEHLARVMLAAPDPETPAQTRPVERPESGERARREEGRTGREDGRLARARGEAAERDRRVANEAGILGVLNEDAGLSALMGDGALAGARAGLGNLHGPLGVQLGTGLGERGDALGGGGRAYTGLDVGTGPRHGADHGRPPEQVKQEGQIRAQTSTVMGSSLSRSEIDTVMKRNLNRFRYCYQRQLMRDASLEGKVVLNFSIAKDGSVSGASVRTSTVPNAEVGACMTQVMFSLQFPEPRGGGVVLVSYPFLFSPG